jgi:hypothetical protein
MTGDYPIKYLDKWNFEEIVAVLTKIPPKLEDELISWIENFPRLFLLARF